MSNATERGSLDQIRLDGQVAIVTGGGRGLGRSHALELARRGARILVNDIGGVDTDEGPRADRVVAEIIAAGGEAIASHDDVAKPETGEALVNAALDAFGTVDIVVNNAGFARNALIEDMTLEMFDAVIDVCLRAAFCVTKPAWKVMKQKGYGRVVITGSASGAFGRRAGSNYCASKAGLMGLTRALSHEGADCGIAVNCVLPISRTEMIDDDPIPEMKRLIDALTAVEGRDEPERASALVAYLASRECTVNGHMYSSALGRYARGFVALGQGWLSPGDRVPTAEDVARHMEEIDAPDDLVEYTAVFDELEKVGARINASSAG